MKTQTPQKTARDKEIEDSSKTMNLINLFTKAVTLVYGIVAVFILGFNWNDSCNVEFRPWIVLSVLVVIADIGIEIYKSYYPAEDDSKNRLYLWIVINLLYLTIFIAKCILLGKSDCKSSGLYKISLAYVIIFIINVLILLGYLTYLYFYKKWTPAPTGNSARV
jgi:hypothetical protein